MQTFSARDKVWSHTVSLIGKRPWLGYGVGKKVFVEVYSESDPPESVFYYPHPHQYGLAVLFSLGIVGGVLYGTMWILLMLRLARATFRERSGYLRIVPGTVALMMGMILLYGMGDYPDSLVKYALIWLIPVALVVTREVGAAPSAGGEP
jgi:O-antigen ligase